MITAVDGLPGAGKTYFAVSMIVKARKSEPDLRVWSNTPLWLYHGEPVGVVHRLEEVLSLERGLIFLDEVHLWMASQDWNRKDGGAYREWVSQTRKRGIRLIYTTQAFGGVDKMLRERTFYLYRMVNFRAFRLFYSYWSYLDLGEPIGKKHHGLVPWSEAIACCYDTRFQVMDEVKGYTVPAHALADDWRFQCGGVG